MSTEKQRNQSLFDAFGKPERVSTLSSRQQRLVTYLKNGGKHSAIDISIALHIGDARSEIRNIRNLGICVSDEWVACKGGGKYKLYWIANE